MAQFALSLTISGWIFLLLITLVAMKLIQEGGVRYGRGERWEFITLAGGLVFLIVPLSMAYMMLKQNGAL
ncbi:hypothetical protein [Roseibium sp.]|uniref:hypothetical protein n=1 Tax=Roseibium sp. TaxID=1936156 RepID=UPI00329A51A4